MPVDISEVLHVLAHELRTPSGIAQGYVRMLLEDRLSADADRRRALEQIQKALTRVSELTRESTRLAEWHERDLACADISLGALVAGVVGDPALEALRVVSAIEAPAAAAMLSVDVEAVSSALVAVVKATAREIGSAPCAVGARVSAHAADVLIGRDDQFASLAAGPEAPGAAGLALERGGLGLSLVMAVAVLETHAAAVWTTAGSRSVVGIRLPLRERAPQ